MAELASTAVILAAGLGTRMKSALPKAAHKLAGQPMLRHLMQTCAQVFDRIVVVIGPDMPLLADIAAPCPVIVQKERLGTGHAALQAQAEFGDGTVAILYADNPLVRPETLRCLLQRQRQGDAGLALLSMRVTAPNKYGRVMLNGDYVERIVEFADATEAERAETLCNAGVFCADAAALRQWLGRVGNTNKQAEYYLTDIVGIAHADGVRVAAVEAPEAELRGVNSRAELADAEHVVQQLLRRQAMDGGATLVAPDTVFLSADTRLGPDTVVHPHVVFGPGVTVNGPVEIRAFSHLEGCVISPGATIGPYARIRPGSEVGPGAHVGNFVELKAARLGENAKANHLSYIGDADVGACANIGAGTITANYDGQNKYRTTIGKGGFIGSNSTLVAPVVVADGAMVTAGAVITTDVPADAMAIARARQVNKEGFAALFRGRKRKI